MENRVIILPVLRNELKPRPRRLRERADDLTNVVTNDRVADYRERHYNERFGAFMREWVAFSEDRRNGQEHPLAPLRKAHDAFVLATLNYGGFLQRGDNLAHLSRLRRVRRVVELLGECNVQLSLLPHISSCSCDEMDDCFVKIDDILIKMEEVFDLILLKPLALPAPS